MISVAEVFHNIDRRSAAVRLGGRKNWVSRSHTAIGGSIRRRTIAWPVSSKQEEYPDIKCSGHFLLLRALIACPRVLPFPPIPYANLRFHTFRLLLIKKTSATEVTERIRIYFVRDCLFSLCSLCSLWLKSYILAEGRIGWPEATPLLADRSVVGQ